MYQVRRSGPSAASISADVRALVNVEQPRILAQSLTFTVQAAQKDVVAAMPGSFDGVTSYTRNATRIEPATVDKLTARLAVKDRTTAGGTLPEDYLFPEVFGGGRNEKRVERALRFGGVLKSGEFIVAGQAAPLDAFGNVRRGELQRILAQVTERASASAAATKKRAGGYFAGQVGKTRGVWKREDGRTRPILIFVSKRPTYRQRLDFEDIARRAADREFRPTFHRLLLKAAGR
jgi:hypothetical protein